MKNKKKSEPQTIELIKKNLDHPRNSYRNTIVSLHRTMNGSVLAYEKPSDSMKSWFDLVLRDDKGTEIARMMTYGHYGNNDLRYAS